MQLPVIKADWDQICVYEPDNSQSEPVSSYPQKWQVT